MIPIIYASTSGNVEATCEKVADLLGEAGFATTLHRVEKSDFSLIENNPIFIMATSTWEHGELNPFFDKMLTEISTHSMDGKKSAFIGLGDTRYEQVLFCKGIDIVRDAFVKSGGQEINTTLKINGEPYQYFDTTVLNWTNRLIELFKNEST